MCTRLVKNVFSYVALVSYNVIIYTTYYIIEHELSVTVNIYKQRLFKNRWIPPIQNCSVTSKFCNRRKYNGCQRWCKKSKENYNCCLLTDLKLTLYSSLDTYIACQKPLKSVTASNWCFYSSSIFKTIIRL